MTINYKIGCNFDLDSIDAIRTLNQLSPKAKIKEFYGSIRDHSFLTARPAFRLPDISYNTLSAFISKCDQNNNIFNYTFNTL